MLMTGRGIKLPSDLIFGRLTDCDENKPFSDYFNELKQRQRKYMILCEMNLSWQAIE